MLYQLSYASRRKLRIIWVGNQNCKALKNIFGQHHFVEFSRVFDTICLAFPQVHSITIKATL